MSKHPSDMILFSIQDLFGYWKAHVTMSGIQRVQAGIALHAIATQGDNVGFILNDLTESRVPGEFLLIDNTMFATVIDYASGEQVDHDRLRDLLAEVEEAAERFIPVKGQTIILLGAFWGHGNTIDQYLASRRQGVILGAYVYDIIPITHPEYCQPDLVRDHSMAVCEMGMVVDFILTISDYTQRTLKKFFAEYGGREIPMRTVRLAHSLTAGTPARSVQPAALRAIRGNPYVAYVSTVEGRKNHRYVVEAWQQLIEQGVDVPHLVFVGRKGWRIAGLMDLLDGTRNVDGRVHIVHDLSDAELNGVYADSLFTVFTSFVEGWGLPVGESLVHGTPCVASGTSSMPEVGGDFVDYVDPLNIRDGVAVFRRLIEDAAYRDRRRRQIGESFVPRTWDDVGRDFLVQLRTITKADGAQERPIHPLLKEGTWFRPGSLVTEPIRFRDYVPGPMRMALREDWYALEDHGVWMRGAAGEVSFLTGLDAGTEIIVYLDLGAVPNAAGKPVSVRLAGGEGPRNAVQHFHFLEPSRRNLIRVRGRTLSEGLCTVAIDVEGELEPRPFDDRLIAVGLSGVGFVRADNAELRDDLVERITFHDMTDRAS